MIPPSYLSLSLFALLICVWLDDNSLISRLPCWFWVVVLLSVRVMFFCLCFDGFSRFVYLVLGCSVISVILHGHSLAHYVLCVVHFVFAMDH